MNALSATQFNRLFVGLYIRYWCTSQLGIGYNHLDIYEYWQQTFEIFHLLYQGKNQCALIWNPRFYPTLLYNIAINSALQRFPSKWESFPLSRYFRRCCCFLIESSASHNLPPISPILPELSHNLNGSCGYPKHKLCTKDAPLFHLGMYVWDLDMVSLIKDVVVAK